MQNCRDLILQTNERFADGLLQDLGNFVAPLVACQTVLPALIDAGWGRIVNITSDSSRTGASKLAVYAGTKGGLLAFSKSLAHRYVNPETVRNLSERNKAGVCGGLGAERKYRTASFTCTCSYV